MLRLYALAIFTSAALLFLVQPIAARLILPLLGGSPAVWNTAMVFFQALLLGGYLYAHLLTTRLRPRSQIVVHAIVVLGAAALLPIALPRGWEPPTTGSPVWSMLWALALSVGLPFFAISSAGPLLQKWFSTTDHPKAKDPYFLYAASNAGSMIGLLAYPLAVEPGLRLTDQRHGWSIGYGVFILLAAACGAAMLKRPARAVESVKGAKAAAKTPAKAAPVEAVKPVTWARRGMWVLLAAVPSSLLLGATQFISTDVAAAPMLWIAPLTLYLLTFILAFSPRIKLGLYHLGLLYGLIAIVVAVAIRLEVRTAIVAMTLVHLLGLTLACLMCHRRLADDRPDAARLTEFYLLISVGGVVGGSFNALAAPVIFTSVAEYPIAIVLACLLAVRKPSVRVSKPWVKLADPLGWTIAALLVIGVLTPAIGGRLASTATTLMREASQSADKERQAGLEAGAAFMASLIPLVNAVGLALPLVLALVWRPRPLRFALVLAVGMALVQLGAGQDGGAKRLLAARTFFGVHRVFEGGPKDRMWHTLKHGTTTHGVQATFEPMRFKPTSYYHPTGPVGSIFSVYAGTPVVKEVAAVGLGAGSIAAYMEPGERITFYEIDNEVIRIASDPEYFWYIDEARKDGATVEMRPGDGRLELAKAADGEYGLIMLDAFSSDAIPVHLMTLEAVEMYRRKLRPDGLLAFHVSNLHLDLAPVLTRIAEKIGMVPIMLADTADVPPELQAEFKSRSIWVVLANNSDAVKPLMKADGRWVVAAYEFLPSRYEGLLKEIGAGKYLRATRVAPLWTDDYSNILGVLRY